MQLWEESDAHIPLANYHQLISSGQNFREVYWPLQPPLVQAELVSPGPALQACPPNAVFQKAEPAAPTQENQGTTLTPIPSPKHSPKPSRASSSTPRMDRVASRLPSVVPI